MRRVVLGLGVLAAGVMPVLAWTAASPEAGPVRTLYQQQCQGCHGATMSGGFAPALKGDAFVARWRAKGDAGLAAYIHATMPPGQPASLTPAQAKALAALLLPGSAAGQVDPSVLAPASVPAPAPVAAGYHDGADENAADLRSDPISAAEQEKRGRLAAAASLVTEAMLRAPSDADWIAWRRTRDAQAHSPLTQIDRGTVGHLGVAWSLALGQGTNGVAPLVHDGVMYLVSNHEAQAINAANGDVLWTHARPVETTRLPLSQPRGIALHGTALYVPTIDSHMLALDVRTGAVLWDHAVRQGDDVLQMTGAPLIADGKVIQGVAGCALADVPGGCFIVALDAATGEEVWRVHSIARPGDPGGDSWNGAPLERRFGGSVWTGGSYDADLGLVYFGTAQTYAASTLLNGASGSRDALYTNSTLAIDPATGRIAWAYQHFPGDVWDMDWGFERTIVPMKAAASGKAIVTVGKMGVMDAIDARTGRYIRSKDLGLQTLVTAIEPKTGRKSYNAALVPARDRDRLVCPSSLGGRNWPATAFDPARSLLYVPLVEACMTLSLTEPGGSEYRMKVVPPPEHDGNFGQFAAIDLSTGDVRWRIRQRAPEMSAALSTAGGLVFEGSRDRYFRALDAQTGRVLWRVRLDNVPNSFPISYAVNGRQYVAVVAGGGSPYEVGVRNLTPELGQGPGGNKTLWVFALLDGKGE